MWRKWRKTHEQIWYGAFEQWKSIYIFAVFGSIYSLFRSRMPKSGGQELRRVSGSRATLCLVYWGGEWPSKYSHVTRCTVWNNEEFTSQCLVQFFIRMAFTGQCHDLFSKLLDYINHRYKCWIWHRDEKHVFWKCWGVWNEEIKSLF